MYVQWQNSLNCSENNEFLADYCCVWSSKGRRVLQWKNRVANWEKGMKESQSNGQEGNKNNNKGNRRITTTTTGAEKKRTAAVVNLTLTPETNNPLPCSFSS